MCTLGVTPRLVVGVTQNLDCMGLINDRMIAVHMTQLTDDEIAIAAAKGLSVVHCPVSNLKLGSGE